LSSSRLRKRHTVINPALPSDVPEQAFQPQLDPLPAVAFMFVFAAYFAVQLTVRKAVDAREHRELMESQLKQARVQQLAGNISLEGVRETEARLKEAYETEKAAAEVLVIGSLRLRVRVPRPIGTPLEDLQYNDSGPPKEDEKATRSGMQPRKHTEPRPRLLEELSRDGRTSLVLALTVLCLWLLIGLASDPTAPPPEWLQEMAQASK